MDAQVRVRRLIDAARQIADPETPLGKLARERLPDSTGLSPAGVDFALRQSLEADATDAEIEALCQAATPVGHAHVLLSANVFVAALRAIAIALAAAPRVSVRSSRREGVMAELLQSGSDAFDRVEALEPRPGDHVWAYGSDQTIESLRQSLPPGVVVHGHGTGFGVAVVELDGAAELEPIAAALARDVALFDQRGCLSPRICIVLAERARARRFAEETARALGELELSIPRGRLSAEEAADERRFRDAAAFAFELFAAGQGAVSFDAGGERWIVPPAGRNLHLARADVRDLARLGQLEPSIVALGVSAACPVRDELRALLRYARVSALGSMQRPRLDGPVDRRCGALPRDW